MKPLRSHFALTATLLAATILPCSLALTSLRAHEKEAPKATASPAAATYVCPMHPEVTDTKASKCPKCGMTLVAKAAPETNETAMHHEHGGDGGEMNMSHEHSAPTIKTEIVTAEPPAPGKGVAAIAKLTRPDGKPLTFADLNEAHTKRIHLLIIDDSLTDYYHEHPVETKTPGEFAFNFHPKNGGRYTVWADIVPTVSGNQEYSRAEITVPGAAAPMQPTLNQTTTVEGYRFDLSTADNEKLVSGKATLVKLLVTDAKGQPVKTLEPVMGAFAHGVGFDGALSGVTHVHPMGKEPQEAGERGGPELSFHLLPEKAGYLKFYVQVQLGGKDVYAGFGLNVDPEQTAMAH